MVSAQWNTLTATPRPTNEGEPPVEATITLHVDGHRRELTVDTRTTLLDALRDRLGEYSPKKAVTTANAEPARSWPTGVASCPA